MAKLRVSAVVSMGILHGEMGHYSPTPPAIAGYFAWANSRSVGILSCSGLARPGGSATIGRRRALPTSRQAEAHARVVVRTASGQLCV